MSENLLTLGAAARGVSALGKSQGSPFPNFWREPGRNARPIVEIGSYALTGGVASAVVATVTVSEGFRAFLTGVVFEVVDADGWVEGSGSITLRIQVTSTAGTVRPVPYLGALTTSLGSRFNGPYEMPAFWQFNNSNIITATVSETGVVPAGAVVIVHLVGYEIPESEAIQ